MRMHVTRAALDTFGGLSAGSDPAQVATGLCLPEGVTVVGTAAVDDGLVVELAGVDEAVGSEGWVTGDYSVDARGRVTFNMLKAPAGPPPELAAETVAPPPPPPADGESTTRRRSGGEA
ncbi:MAG TPA: hypothetical protein VJ653_07325 [Acidimicrobiales bacterium]|nr:hypothetical protein [Acidimicrobiales bacterium]